MSTMSDSTSLFTEDNDEDNFGWDETLSGRDGIIFLIDCSDQTENIEEHVKESFKMVEQIMMGGIVATGKTMV